MAGYDVIVVGARCAGSSTAMLLARKGLRVLVVDRAAFPSDTLSTHQVQLPGIASLARWGLLDRVADSNAPATRHVRFDQDGIVLEGDYPSVDGVDAMYSPRRTILDSILVDAAREAGAEVREGVIVDEVTNSDGVVTGIRGRTKGGGSFSEKARIVIGADGKHSIVARSAGAAVERDVPVRTAACYAYWDGLAVKGGEIYGRPGRAVGAWPTNDGLTLTFVAWPIGEFDSIRGDLEGSLVKALDGCGDLGERARGARRVEPVRGTTDLPNTVRTAFGPGWALVGDAGLVMDPVTGQGIADAFRDAELLAGAVSGGFGGRQMDEALAGYQRARDEAVLPMFDFTLDVASLAPPPVEARVLFSSLAAGPQHEVDRFLAVVAGAIPLREYMTPGNLRRIVGFRGIAKIVAGKVRGRRARAA
jgi:2-polyprenyl-6-methoxyphenol hydroxylase-like FAD-dependent oxidoreductase